MAEGFLKRSWWILRDHLYYHLFLLILLIFVIYHYRLTFTARNIETILLPRLVLGTMGVLIGVELLKPLLLPPLREVGLFPKREQADAESDEEDDGGDPGIENLRPILRDGALVILYLITVYYIGMFTSTFLFSFVYIFMNTDAPTILGKAKPAVTWSLGFVVAMYIMFVEILGSFALLSFGFLP
jgi:hypothetical protein